jgi:hypothetical protein
MSCPGPSAGQPALVVIEHDLPVVMSISDPHVLPGRRELRRQGSPAQVRNDPQVIAAYLGTDAPAIDRSGKARRAPSSRRGARRRPAGAQA